MCLDYVRGRREEERDVLKGYDRTLAQEYANFFAVKGQLVNILGFTGLWFCCCYSTQGLQCRSEHRKYGMGECGWPNKISFIKMRFGPRTTVC